MFIIIHCVYHYAGMVDAAAVTRATKDLKSMGDKLLNSNDALFATYQSAVTQDMIDAYTHN